jgi:molybdopterin synthase catalytic subunit
MSAHVHLAEVTSEPLDATAIAALVSDSSTGAVVVFSGDVRDHDHGRAVLSLTYESHPTAAAVMNTVVRDLAEQLDVTHIAAAHRVGDIPIGEAALVVAVGSSHRGDAFGACREIVDQIKLQLPVWKHQYFADGTDEWVNCA